MEGSLAYWQAEQHGQCVQGDGGGERRAHQVDLTGGAVVGRSSNSQTLEAQPILPWTQVTQVRQVRCMFKADGLIAPTWISEM